MKSLTLLIQPRDPLIVRDGRDFSAAPGAKARGFDFPPPQVLAGAIRGQLGYALGYQPFAPRHEEQAVTLSCDEDAAGDLGRGAEWLALKQKVSILGPLLYRLPKGVGGDEPGSTLQKGEVFYPAPLDAVLFKDRAKEEYQLFRLSPPPIEDCKGLKTTPVLSNLPFEYFVEAPTEMPKDKPESMPRFWRGELFIDWLLGKVENGESFANKEEMGFEGLPHDRRTHVKIERAAQTAEEHMLFETDGLVFASGEEGRLAWVDDISLLLRVEADGLGEGEERLRAALNGVKPLGGKRRLALWEVVEEDPFTSSPPDELIEEIARTRRAKVVLLTPADFNTQGNDRPYVPKGGDFGGAKIKAAAIGRPLVVSGWDILRGKPKCSRRLVPAGSVYFVDLCEVSDIEAWVKAHWLKMLAHQPEQSRRDGYGLVVVGVWG